jgi:integrase
MKQPYLLYQRGAVWYVRFENEKTFHSTGLRNRVDAEAFAHNELRLRSQRRSPAATLYGYARDFFIWDSCKWVARQRAKKRPFSKAVSESRRGHLSNYLFPRFGDAELSDITAVEIEDWLVLLPLANQTRNHILYSLSIILREAVRDGIIDKNPAESVEPMGKDFRATSALGNEDLAALFPEDQDEFSRIWPELQFGVMFFLMVTSGMRPGEARALEWSSVLLDIPAVLVLQAITASEEIGPTKGKERRGAIIPKQTADLLRRWHDTSSENESFVFRSIHDGFHSRKATYNRFRDGLKRAQINTDGRQISMRNLRTTYNTRMRQMLLANSMSEDVLRFFIGHRSVQMTDRYDSPELAAKLKSMQSFGKEIDRLWD